MSEYYKDANRYDDIINLAYHKSADREHMSLHDRAAQFAPFAALTGHEDAIEETSRLTDDKIILDDNAIEKINEKIYNISQHLLERWNVSVTYFRPDALKRGGAYLTDVGTVMKVDVAEKMIIMDSGMKIDMGQIVGIEIMK
ncbi:MAG: hypothetical protein IJD58_04330 [Lachnospiraceae bacterium]|nr:hypothetical protein [Lachnospiraceae bacterium]